MLSPILDKVSQFIVEQGERDGYFPTPIEGLGIMRMTEGLPPNGTMYRPSLCITLQGAKEVGVGDRLFVYDEMSFLLVAIDVPAYGRVTRASPERPYVGLSIEIDTAVLRAVLDELEDPPAPSADDRMNVFSAPLEGQLADSVLRLVTLLDNPQAITVLKPAIMREICFWLLTGPHGADFCKIVLPQTHLYRISQSVRYLRENFTRVLRMEELAEAARMSASSFHQHFKAVTGSTPLQYQKQLRLMEARRLMTTEDFNVSAAAFAVGYESASQFSREYMRMYSKSPKRDVQDLKSLLARLKSPLPDSINPTPNAPRATAGDGDVRTVRRSTAVSTM